MLAYYLSVNTRLKEKRMAEEILGEPSNFVGSTTPGGAYIGYRNPRRSAGAGGGRGGQGGPTADELYAYQVGGGRGGQGGPTADELAAYRDTGGVSAGAERPVENAATEVNIISMNGYNEGDSRVRIRVPSDYLTGTTGPNSTFGGILFPYTPTISMEHKADYTSYSPMHSNYAIQFYKSSSIPDISIAGKFTVQNDSDAIFFISTMQLLASLTKMRWAGDKDAGAPPPICRLDAYGPFMFKNVPVVISGFKHDLPDGVDFYTLNSPLYGNTSVPTIATFTITCKPTYSRAEMLTMSTSKFIEDKEYRNKGYL
jgi:hypothetical protein